MREERIEPAGVPAKLYDPGDGRGLLLLGHGGGSSKDEERFVALGRQLAEGTGLRVVCIDAVGHGERSGAEDVRRTMGSEKNAALMTADWRAVADELGNPVAYVGYSMGMLYGAPTVAAMPEIKAAVFGVGGIPALATREQLPNVMHDRLLAIAAQLTHPQVLLLNMTKDETFPVAGVHEFFDAIPGRKKRLMFWEGDHVGLPAESTRQAIAFVNKYT
ncbi:MAG TPA: alpha/beta fold hydrolase [Acidimicrobiales bacterium]|jgi:pimeloyl-ACP methyl ester carboxylesterase